ncbi:MAG: preprotein translocase subunit YajC [Syntrophomonadaceae bacterium]|nr:preprotein translocase subunit YajC [Syntrophomonadaceae bacterium]
MLFGQTAAETWTSSLMFLVAFFAIFYFLIILPRKKQEKKHKEMVQNLRVHDRIVTIGGIHGEVKKIKEKTLILKVSDNAEIEILKSAVAYLQDEE